MKACATGYVLNKSGRQLTICPQLPPDRFKSEILFGCTISPGTTLLIERSVFDHVGLFDDNLSRLEDWDWLLRFAECHDITFVSRPLATIYTNNWQEHLQFDENDQVMQSIRRIEKKHLPRIAAQGTSTRAPIPQHAFY